MGKSNLTIWEHIGQDRKPVYRMQECMMHIASYSRDFKIIIPREWLNDNLTKESVYKWLEIGNKTIFPAIINEIEIDRSDLNSEGGQCQLGGVYHDLVVEPRNLVAKERYRSSDVVEMPSGSIKYISATIDQIKSKVNSGSYFTTSCRRLQTRGANGRPIVNNDHNSSWRAYIQDLQVAETKEPLRDHILRTYDELSKKEVQLIPAYEVIIPCARAISNSHKLAILSFYRYLYSSRYPGLVQDTLKLESIGIDPWTALYYALSKKDANYSFYYSLLSVPGFKSMADVSRDLKNYSLVNKAFSVSEFDKNLYVTLDGSDEELIAKVDIFTKATPKKAVDDNAYKCIVASKTLTLNKVYKSAYIKFNKIRVCGDDYKYRYYSAYMFKKEV